MLHQNPTTVPSITQDYPEWHRGRKDYALWLIELGNEEIHKKVHAAREHLAEFLLKPYQRQPHITLFVCGFLADTPRFKDDYGREELRVHTQLLNDSKVKPFSIEIGKLNSFASAPFLEVDDSEGGIHRVRSLLSNAAKEIGRSAFMPHLTVGLYSGTFSSTVVGRRISTFSSEPVRFKVERITFASYQAQEIAGPLSHTCDVALPA